MIILAELWNLNATGIIVGAACLLLGGFAERGIGWTSWLKRKE